MIVAVDYGDARCGLAIGEKLARKIMTVEKKKVISEISRIPFIDCFVVGLPLSMSGRYSQQTFKAIEFAEKLNRRFKKRVYLIDERLTSSIFKNRENIDGLCAAEIFEKFVFSKMKFHEIIPPIKVSDNLVNELNNMAGNILIVGLSDTRLVCKRRCIVLQEEPYYAYLFYKLGCHVERYADQLENFAPFDIIVAGKMCDKLKAYLKPEGKLLCL